MKQTISVSQIKQAVNEAYDLYKNNQDGKNADYIPYLANIDKNLFGISVCLLDGQIIEVGDTQYRFGIESVSKVHTAILVLRQYGAEKLLSMIGADATGLPFNSIIAILLENDHPSTPLVNAGAITACSMVQPVGNPKEKWAAIVKNITELSGNAPELIDELYRSESATNFNNRSITWLLKNYNRIYDDPDLSLDLYTRQCSLGITAEQLSVCGATIANKGVNPKKRSKSIRCLAVSSNYIADSDSRILRTHRRLALHFGNPCKNRSRRRCHGSSSRNHGYCSLCTPYRCSRQLS